MDAATGALGAALAALSPWEALAVVLAIAYLLLAVRENIWCWACAFGSTAIYIVLFYDVALLQESLLNVYYLAMAVYGWHHWRRGGTALESLPVRRWSWRRHLLVILGTGAVSLLIGWFFANFTRADWPFLDAFTTWFSVVTTWMVARKILENWIYWFVIDAASIYLYLQKGLVLTAVLFAVYLVIVVFGYRRWRAAWRAEQGLV